MDSQQELFSALLVALKKELECGVYDGFLPSEDTAYPFVYLADSQLVDDYGNKTMLMGTVSQTIDVWSNNPRKRGELSDVMNQVKEICRKLTHTKSYAWQVTSINQTILADTSTSVPLMHGALNIDFKIRGGQI